jgi:outer membrane receptor protein involved in Fe transport
MISMRWNEGTIMRRTWLAASGLTAAILSAAGGANAQTVAPEATQDQVAGSSAGGRSLEELVVTGSRLQTTILNSPTPVVAVTAKPIEQTGTDNLERILTQIPAIGVGLTDTDSENYYAEAGLNLIDLRHLGYNRTLVLVNGRRQVPGDIYTTAVDLNSIPAPLVDRVEVVTGGASAVYGADAVSGVVNIILKDHYQGFLARVRGAITGYGDGGQYGFSFLAGKNFANDKGNITASLLYDNTDGVKATQRSYAVSGIGYFLNPNGGAPNNGPPIYLTLPNVRYAGINQLGLIGPVGGAFYTPINNGTAVRPYDTGSRGLDANFTQIGGDGGFFQPFDNLSLPIHRVNSSFNATYDVSPHAELFLEARDSVTWSSTRWQPAADFQYGSFPISASNPFVPANLQPLLAQAGQTSFDFGREYTAFGERGGDSDRLSQQYTGGIRGDLWGRFKYEAFAGYGQTDLHTVLVGGRDQTKFLQSVDVISLDGQPACADPAARAAGCQPFNPFNPESTPAGIAYSSTGDTYRAKQSLTMAGAHITGDLFNLPAGPVGAVVGVEARENFARTYPSILAQQGNVQLFCEQPEEGHVTTEEAYGELRVPLLKDLPLIHSLSVQGAGRYSHYNTNGDHFSWNVGGVYSPIDSINFRVMLSRAVRAPNVDELYSTESQTFLNLEDPCSVANQQLNANRAANCAALGIPAGFVATSGSKAAYFGGNPHLNVETADTLTVGMTVAPRFLPDVSFTVDYYDVNLTNAIGAIDPQTLLNDCVDLPISVTSNAACAAITRDPGTHQITGVFSNNQNIGRIHTRGVDFTATYNAPLQRISERIPGKLVFNVTGTYLDKLRQYTNASDLSTESQFEGFLGLPKWQVLGDATYSIRRLAVTWRLRFIDSTSVEFSQLVQQPLPTNLHDTPTTGSEFYNDLSVSYDINATTNMRVNIDNLFNVAPPARGYDVNEGISYGASYGTASIYPNLGITFSFVLQHKF